MSRALQVKKTATKKGFFALLGCIGTGFLYAKTHWILGVAGSVGSIYLIWDWFKWRAKHGLRF